MSASRQLGGKVVEAHGLAAEALGQADRAVVVAVGDEHRVHAARRAARGRSARRSRRRRPPARGAIARSPQDVGRQLHGDGRDRHARAAEPVSVRTRLPAAEGVAEEAVGDRPGRALDQRQLVGALDLALDLGLADDHRVEAGGDRRTGGARRRAAQRVERSRRARSAGCRPGGRAPTAPRSRPRRRRRPPGRARCGCRWRWPPPRGSTRARSSLEHAGRAALRQRQPLAQRAAARSCARRRAPAARPSSAPSLRAARRSAR